MLCSHCGAPVPRGREECPGCGNAVYAKDRARQVQNHSLEEQQDRQLAEQLFIANHEVRRYGLMPRGENESIGAYADRIDREKTPQVVAHNLKIAESLDQWNKAHGIDTHNPMFERLRKIADRNSGRIEREPGEDG